MSFTIANTLFLLNPNSGKRNSQKIIARLQKADKNVNFIICKSKNELSQLFASIDKKYKVLVICGGDGTINSILPYTKNSNLIFAVWPNGSGNGFAREMGFSNKIEKLFASIKKGATKKIDVIKINDSYFCNVAGVGFDSYIADKFDKNGKRGLITYVIETIKALFSYPQIYAEIKADENVFTDRFFMICLANTRQFGNNIIIAPKANPGDGLIDLVCIRSFPKILVPLILLKIVCKKGKNSKYIHYLKAKEITIKTNYNTYHVDGEPIIKDEPILAAKRENSMTILNAI
ncbi:YegS/Rv2252/BmrU family lipid kinase [uncultured Draconibacterium sp.]|uniref:diacylglycerol/lipid kinase family protein n=1 Tax=uncultured Draconibacterium sp. TaxID=1573823 RepID=UPI003216F324